LILPINLVNKAKRILFFNLPSMPQMSLHDRIDNLPSFEEIPQISDLPKGCTWGLWDKDSRDELGTLNFLTPATVKKSGSEIREGISVSLKYGPC